MKLSATNGSDHDYFTVVNANASTGGRLIQTRNQAAKNSILAKNISTTTSYIEEDAPPKGYGPGVGVVERRINVTTGGRSGGVGMTRTVVLHVPKDIK